MKSSLLLLACSLPGLLAAAPFQNFGFDSPEIPGGIGLAIPGPTFEGAPEVWMVPGWDVPNGVGYNHTQPFRNLSSILDSSYVNNAQPANSAKVPVVGTYSLGIWPHAGIAAPSFFLAQTGDIPSDAQSLRFLYHGNDLHVSVAGSPAPVHFLEDRPSGDPDVPLFHYYAVDVSAYAGQTAPLQFEFRSFGNFPGQDEGQVPGWPDAKMHVIDDISFSPLPAVPEPETWALFGVGVVAVFCVGRRKT